MNPVDKVVLLINGDVGSGSYIAENLAKNRCKVALTYNNRDTAENIKNRIEKVEGIINIYKNDNIEEILKNVKNDFGKINILINNIYVNNDKSPDEFSLENLKDYDIYYNYIKAADRFLSDILINIIYSGDNNFSYKIIKKIFNTSTKSIKSDKYRIVSINVDKINVEFIDRSRIPDIKGKITSNDIANAILFSLIEENFSNKIINLSL